jgi:RNA processing factor Prp31
MKITFEINIDEYPILNNFKDNARQNIIEEIFKTGYNIHFPSLEKIEQNHQYNELLCQINNSEINDKLTNLESSLTKLIGISSNSSKI